MEQVYPNGIFEMMTLLKWNFFLYFS